MQYVPLDSSPQCAQALSRSLMLAALEYQALGAQLVGVDSEVFVRHHHECGVGGDAVVHTEKPNQFSFYLVVVCLSLEPLSTFAVDDAL